MSLPADMPHHDPLHKLHHPSSALPNPPLPPTPDVSAAPNSSTPPLTHHAVASASTTPALPNSTPPHHNLAFVNTPPAPPLTPDHHHHHHHHPHPHPPTQSKWRVTPAQKDALLKAFDDDAYPELQKKVHLAEQLGVTTAQISKWFQHRRESLTRLGQFKAQYNRTRRTPEELDVLQAAFEEDRYPTAERLAQLSAQLQGVTAKQIKLWFKHRRKQVQKRNRSTSSPNHPNSSVSRPHPSNPSSLMRNPDLAAVGPDQNRQEWRPGATAVAPQSVQPAQSLPPGTIMQPTSPNPVAYPFDPQHYYAYKAQPIVLAPPQGQAQLSDMELMALRGAHAVLNSKPSQEGLFRLSQMLNRPHSLLIEWFRSQEAFRPADQVGDMHQSFVQSPVLTQTDQAIARHANSAPRSQADNQSTPILQDFRKTDTDISMGTAGDSPNIIQSTKLQNGREQDPNKNLHHQVDPKTMPDSSSAMRQGVAQEGSTAGAIVQQVPAGIYPTYMYSNGLDGGMMMPHQTSAFHAAPGAASAPMLAPLRYVSGSSANAQTYIPQNMWYHPAPSFPK